MEEPPARTIRNGLCDILSQIIDIKDHEETYMTVQTICIGILGILFGLAVAFAGYRYFLMLLPIWGFIAGFIIGAQALQALLGTGFLAEVSSWVFGIVLGIIFAALAYFFYIIGVAILAGSFGYALGAGIVYAISANWDVVAFLVGVMVAIVVAALVILLNIQKLVIILITSLGGAGAFITGILIMIGSVEVADIGSNAILSSYQENWIWFLIGIVIAAAGFVVQMRSTSRYTLEPPLNRA